MNASQTVSLQTGRRVSISASRRLQDIAPEPDRADPERRGETGPAVGRDALKGITFDDALKPFDEARNPVILDRIQPGGVICVARLSRPSVHDCHRRRRDPMVGADRVQELDPAGHRQVRLVLVSHEQSKPISAPGKWYESAMPTASPSLRRTCWVDPGHGLDNAPDMPASGGTQVGDWSAQATCGHDQRDVRRKVRGREARMGGNRPVLVANPVMVRSGAGSRPRSHPSRVRSSPHINVRPDELPPADERTSS